MEIYYEITNSYVYFQAFNLFIYLYETIRNII